MRSVILSMLVATALACGHDPSEPSADAANDAPAADDASVDASVSYGFSPPVRVNELNTSADEDSPSLASGGLSIYFTRREPLGGFLVNVPYVARRAELSAPFSSPVRAAAFGTLSLADLELADDELEWLYWMGLGQIATSTRPDADDGWSPPAQVGFDGFSPSLSTDGLQLYVIALDGTILVRARASRGAGWGAPKIVPVSLGEAIEAIDISVDSRRLLMTTAYGVWIASRNEVGDPFESPELLFYGDYENARFGASDRLISLVDLSGSDRQISIARSR